MKELFSRGSEEEGRLISLAASGLFPQFRTRIESKFGIEYKEAGYSNFFDYVSSLFLVDMLDTSFTGVRITLSSPLSVLDVGAGGWQYVKALYRFLQHYQGERNVFLTGVDIKGEDYYENVGKLTRDLQATYLSGDIFSLDQQGTFDMVFMAHMLHSPQHFERWGLKYSPPSNFFEKGFGLLKPEGLFVGIAHRYAGEAAIFNEFPKDKKIFGSIYAADLDPRFNNFLSGYHTFNENVIVSGRNLP